MNQPAKRALVAGIIGAVVYMLRATAAGQLPLYLNARDRSHRCTYGSWSSPIRAPGAFDSKVIRTPSLSGTRSEIYLAANLMPAWPVENWTRSVPKGPVVIRSLDGSDLGRPEGGTWFLGPRLLHDGLGNLYLLWGEPALNAIDSIPLSEFFRTPVMRILYAKYDRKHGWGRTSTAYEVKSIPEHTKRRGLEWTRQGAITIDSSGRIYVVIIDPDNHRAIFRTGNDFGWTGGILPGVRTGYLDVAVDATGTLYVVYLHSHADGSKSQHEVYLTSSKDGGRSWSKAQSVIDLGDRRAYEPRIAIDPAGPVHVLWRQGGVPGSRNMSIRHVVTRNGGKRWSHPSDRRVPYSNFDLRLQTLVDHCGSLHLAFNQAGGLGYGRWNGVWEDTSLLFPGAEAREVGLALAPAGQVQVFWESYRGRDTTGKRVLFIPLISTLGHGKKADGP